MPSILIVDDDPKIRSLVRLIVEIEGHEVVEAGDGYEALGMLDRQNIDLALLDVVMPHMNGVELMQRMQREFPNTKIVTMSAFGKSWICPTELIVEASLTKPFHAEDLRSVLHNVFHESPPPKRTRQSKRRRRK